MVARLAVICWLRRLCLVVPGALFVWGGASCGALPAEDVGGQPADALQSSQAALTNSKLVGLEQNSWDVFASSNANVQVALNNGIATFPPLSSADLNLTLASSSQVAVTKVLTAPAGTLTGQNLASPNALRLPRAGNQTWALNSNVGQKHTETLALNFTFNTGDWDPLDAKLHVRTVGAPVLDYYASHTNPTQSYYFTTLTNLSRSPNTPLARVYGYAGQPNLPWQNNNGTYFTDWQLHEFTPSVLTTRVGDRMALATTAAACSGGAHKGAYYLDTLGSYDAGGTTLVAYAPQYVVAGHTLRYQLRLRQQGNGSAQNVRIDLGTPNDTTFVALGAPSNWQCAAPAVGSGGNLTCTVAALAAGSASNANLDLQVAANAGAAIELVRYGVATASQAHLLGPHRTTQLLASSQAQADLQVTVAEDANARSPNSLTMVVTVHNAGPNAATGVALTDAPGLYFTPTQWTCAAEGDAAPASSSPSAGSGRFTASYDVGTQANVVCRVVLTGDGNRLLDTYGVAAVLPSPGGNANLPLDPVAYNNEGAAFADGNWLVRDTEPAALLALGKACGQNSQCQSNICADGVCCNQACTGVCMACNLAATPGICSPVDGAAPAAGHGSCGPYLCAAGSCAEACDSNAQCAAHTSCELRVCRPQRNVCSVNADCPAGTLCTSAQTCESLALQDPNHPNWQLEGSGCSAHAGNPGLGAWALAGLLARRLRARRGRRRHHLRHQPSEGTAGRPLWRAAKHRPPAWLLLALLVAWPLAARAADDASLGTNPYQPLGGLHDLFGTASAPAAPGGHFLVGAWLNYARAPLRLRHLVAPTTRQNIVAQQGTLDLLAGVALPYGGEVALALPLVLQQNLSAAFASTALSKDHLQFSSGDLRLTPKWTLVRGQRAKLAVAGILTLPSGRRHNFVGRGSVAFNPMLVAEFGRLGAFRLLLNLGALLQNHRHVAGINSHHQLTWSAAAEMPFAVGGGRTLAPVVSVFGNMDLARPRRITTPLEILAGLDLHLSNHLHVHFAGGAGLTRGAGTPEWRALLGLIWQPRPEAPAPEPVTSAADLPPATAPDIETETEAAQAPVRDPNGDDDHDGVINALDACPTVPGDPNGQPPGCPTEEAAIEVVQTFKLVHFGNNAATILPRDVAALQQVREVLLAMPRARLIIHGHTDDTGDSHHNHLLSLARAEAARDWLVAHDIAEARLQARGWGGRQPIQSGRSAAARAANRRVVFALLLPPVKTSAAADGAQAR